ncbi:MAG: SRPBCC family protein [Longimicrobiaceae bacterium]
MIGHIVEAAAEIEAPAERVYGIVADYRVGHPCIIPKSFFDGIEVEEGGYGAGTRIRVGVHLAGRKSSFRADVTEPEPGRVLVETDVTGGPVTTFTVDPLGPARCRMTISTRLQRRGEPAGWLERWFMIRFLGRVYAEELKLLAAVAAEGGGNAESSAQ